MILLEVATTLKLPVRAQLKADCNSLDGSATSLQLAKIQERKNSLQRKLKNWVAIQHLYMPEVSVLRAREDGEASDKTAEIAPYDFKLYLPSSLPRKTTCSSKLKNYEFRMREAQAFEALEELRQHLRLRTFMYNYKDRHFVGQSANTRCQNLIKRVQKKIAMSSSKYRAAHGALTTLSTSSAVSNVGWNMRLLPLEDNDIRPLRDVEDGVPEGSKSKKKKKVPNMPESGSKHSEGHRKLSWIWKVVGVAGDHANESLQEGNF